MPLWQLSHRSKWTKGLLPFTKSNVENLQGPVLSCKTWLPQHLILTLNHRDLEAMQQYFAITVNPMVGKTSGLKTQSKWDSGGERLSLAGWPLSGSSLRLPFRCDLWELAIWCSHWQEHVAGWVADTISSILQRFFLWAEGNYENINHSYCVFFFFQSTSHCGFDLKLKGKTPAYCQAEGRNRMHSKWEPRIPITAFFGLTYLESFLYFFFFPS